MSKVIDLTGTKVGRLTVVCREGSHQKPSGNKESTWRCVCECGKEVVVLGSNLKRGNTLSCGCLQSDNRKKPRRETEYTIVDDVVYVEAFGGVKFIINKCDLDAVLAHRWRINAYGYVADEHGNALHRFLMKPPSTMDIHHITGDKLDNRRSNLLMLTRAEHTSCHNTGTLSNGVIVLPCKVGDKIFARPLGGCKVFEFEIATITIEPKDCPIGHSYTCYGGWSFDDRHWGKTAFLTREEAEAKLKEGQG